MISRKEAGLLEISIQGSIQKTRFRQDEMLPRKVNPKKKEKVQKLLKSDGALSLEVITGGDCRGMIPGSMNEVIKNDENTIKNMTASGM
jgi:hypothetical protein